MPSTRSGCVRFHSSPQAPDSRPASMSCVPIAPSPSRGRSLIASSNGFFIPCSLDRLELTPLDEEVEELRMRLESAMLDPLDEFFQLLAFRAREQCETRALDGGVADLHHFLVRQVRDQADAPRRLHLQVSPETAGQIEDIDRFERQAQRVEEDLKAGDVRALRLGQFVHIALAEVDIAAGVDRDTVLVILEAPELVHPAAA